MAKRILRLPAVKEKVGKSKPGIYSLIKQGKFPRPVMLSTRSVGWLEEEIDQWLASLPRSR